MVAVGIVNDDPGELDTFELYLRGAGHEILYTAYDGREAIEKNRRTPAPVIVMNYMMIHMHGIEATEKILKEFPDTKIILESTRDIREKALAAGAADFLLGPVSGEDLARAVEKASRRL